MDPGACVLCKRVCFDAGCNNTMQDKAEEAVERVRGKASKAWPLVRILQTSFLSTLHLCRKDTTQGA
jgi:hypothetical protein